MIKRILISLIILQSNLSYAQTQENADYRIYSKILNTYFQGEIYDSLKSIVLIEQMIGLPDAIDIFTDFEKDTIPEYALNTLRSITFPKSFVSSFLENPKIRVLTEGLDRDFLNHPVLDEKFFDTPQFDFHPISLTTFNNFFKQPNKSGKYRPGKAKRGWKKIRKKFGTSMIVELSRVKYEGDYAITYFGKYCGGLCGSGNLIVLKKDGGGNWKWLAQFELWVS